MNPLGYDPPRTFTGLGCGLVVPTAIVGTMLLTEDHVPKFQAVSEFLGWVTLCILMSYFLSSLLKRAKTSEKVVLNSAAALGGGFAFLLLTIAEAHPNTPGVLKDIFTRSLQVLGLVGVLALIWFAARFLRNSYRS